MPSQHAARRQAVTYRLPRDVLRLARERARERGETMTAVVERALSEYVTQSPGSGATGE